MKIYLDEQTQIRIKQTLENLKCLESDDHNDLLVEAIDCMQMILDHDTCKSIRWDKKKKRSTDDESF